MSVPNFKAEIEALAAQYPTAWRNAHTGNGQSEDFVRIVAKALHKMDPNVGLNGKRGNYDDISDDVINYFGEGPGHDPKTGSPITVVDFIVNAGANHDDPIVGNRPRVGWQPFSDLGGPGAWVKPEGSNTEIPKAEIPKAEIPRVETPRVETPKVDLSELTKLVQQAVDAAKSAAHDANIAAEASLRVEDQLKRGFFAELGAKFIGSIKGNIKPNN